MKKLYVVLALFTGHPIYAQVEATMPTMTSVAQSVYYNPAVKPRFNFSFALPAVNAFLQFSSNSLSWNKTGYPENGNWTVDLNKIAGHLRERNYYNINAQVAPFLLNFKVGARLHLTFLATVKGYSRIMLPKGLLALTTKGNAPYIGQTLSLSPKIEQLLYLDIGVGGAYSVTRKLTVGGHIKMLRGFFNFTTKDSRIDLTTTKDQINVAASGDFRSSGYESIDNNGPGQKSFTTIVEEIWHDSGKNKGLGLDLGATYQVNDKLLVGASVIDLGFINWTNNTKSYTLDPGTANVSFKGIDLQRVVDNNPDKYIDSLKTALKDKFKTTTANTDSYRTGIPTKVYLTAAYSLGHNATVNGLLFFEKYRERFFPGISASIHKEFGKRLGASLSYTVTNNSYNNLGLGLSTNLAHMQIYVVGDNIAYSWINLTSYAKNLQYFTLRVGLNIVANWNKTEEKSAQPR